jgi:hypothetical protein
VIALQNADTGEIQFVEALDGVDLALWLEVEIERPADLESTAYVVVDGELVPAPRRLSKPEFLDLWSPLETVAVMQSSDGMMAYLWARTLAWDGVFLLSDERVLAGIDHAEAIGLITAESAARKRAGLPPQ